MKLFARDGSQIKIGSSVSIGKGERAKVLAMYQPNCDLEGRVLLELFDGDRIEYFVSEINAQWGN